MTENSRCLKLLLFLDYAVTADILANAASRALGGIINKMQLVKDVKYSTYTKLYDICVRPICIPLVYGV